MKNKFLLLVAALVLSTTATFASSQLTVSTQVNTVTEPNSKSEDMLLIVRTYMEGQGILVGYVCPEPGTSNYMVKDIDGNWYRVYVCESVITGWGQAEY